QNAAKALATNAFAGQIVPVPVKRVTWEGAKKTVIEGVFDRDELPRTDTTLEGLAKLKPAFKNNGTVTAGNASPYSDGAAALLVTSRARADELGAKPVARLIT